MSTKSKKRSKKRHRVSAAAQATINRIVLELRRGTKRVDLDQDDVLLRSLTRMRKMRKHTGLAQVRAGITPTRRKRGRA